MTHLSLIALILLTWIHFAASREAPTYSCHVYIQKIKSGDDFDINVLPDTVVHSPDCTACYAYINNDETKLTSFCVGSTLSAKEPNTKLCSNAEKATELMECDSRECCCYGNDCFDRMREHFTEKTADGEHACKVRRIFPPGERIDMRLNPAFERLACGACYAIKIRDSVEMSCLEYKNVTSVCGDFTDYVGGALACSEEGRACCCQGETCSDEFEAFFFKTRKLPKPTINEPYNAGTYPEINAWIIFTMFLFLFNL
uniref:Domain of unknown function DB domain-containing protein n=1 Tax=Panagrellus redivivus TaxID=6233 RepID=A0A7E4VL93_PANRE